MSSRPHVSLIIPTLDRYDHLERCLRFLALDRYPGPRTVFVVAASTSAQTARVVDEARPLGTLYCPAWTDPAAAPATFAEACNVGLGAAVTGGPAVAVFLNDDTIPQRGWLEPLVDALDDPEVGLVGSLLLFPTTLRIQHAGMGFGPELEPRHLHPYGDPDAIPGVRRAKFLQCVTGACLAGRVDELAEANGFDEAYRNGHEDVDLCFRFRARGRHVLYEPASVLWHHEGQSKGRQDNHWPNRRRFFDRWGAHIVVDRDDLEQGDRMP